MSVLEQGKVASGVLGGGHSKGGKGLQVSRTRLSTLNSKLPKLPVETYADRHRDKRHSSWQEPKHELLALEEKERDEELKRPLESWELYAAWLKTTRQSYLVLPQLLMKKWADLQVEKMYLADRLKLRVDERRTKLMTHVLNVEASIRVHKDFL